MNKNTSPTYVLQPREQEELSRLAFQHQVWKEETQAVWNRAGFKKGQTLMDLGAGSGSQSFDLSKLVGPSGQIISIDQSERFIQYIQEQVNLGLYKNISPIQGDIQQLDWPKNSLDGAIVRWVLMFLAQPEAVIKRVATSLKPGGTFAVMEYVQFRSMSLWPKSTAFAHVYHAVYELLRSAGGDPNIGGRIAEMMQDHGLEIQEIYPISRVGRPGTPLWNWLDATSQNHTNLVEEGLIGPGELNAYYRDWEDRGKRPGAFFTAPPLLVTIGRKPL